MKTRKGNIIRNLLSGLMARAGLILAAALVFEMAAPATGIAQIPAFNPRDYFTLSWNVTGLNMTDAKQVTGSEGFSITLTGTAKFTKVPTDPGLAGLLELVTAARATGKIVARNISTGSEIILKDPYEVIVQPFPTKLNDEVTNTLTLNLQLSGSPSGRYTIVAKLVNVDANIRGFWVPAPLSLSMTEIAGGLVDYTAASAPGGGGAVSSGGGGGGISIPQVPTKVLSITVMGKYQDMKVNDDGGMRQDLRVGPDDGKINIFMKEGTKMLDSSGAVLTNISVSEGKSSQPAPESSSLVGNLYELGPAGAQFQPYLEITLNYTKPLPADIMEKELRVAFWDEKEKKWALLESQVDSQNGTVTARVNHFTLFTVIGKQTPPASFAVQSLDVSPKALKPGEKVTVSAAVSNTGGKEGSYNLQLMINGTAAQSKDLTLAPGAKQNAVFEITAGQPGTYSLNAGGLSGNFSVIAPSLFTVADLEVSPNEAKPGEKVEVSASVSNSGGSPGTHKLELVVNGSILQSKEVTLAPGASEKVSFTVAMDKPGSYSVNLGELSGSFNIPAPPPAPAAFSQSALSISPRAAKPGEKVTISAEVKNGGGSEGVYKAELTINGSVLQSKEVTLAAGASGQASFTVDIDKPGSYQVNLGELSGSFIMSAPPAAPAVFSQSSLSISPLEAKPGEKIAISAEVSNNGEGEGTYKADLMVNGAVLQSKEVTLAAGASEKVSFSVFMEKPGSYKVNLGALSGSLTVKGPSGAGNTGAIIMIASVLAAVGYLVLRGYLARKPS